MLARSVTGIISQELSLVPDVNLAWAIYARLSATILCIDHCGYSESNYSHPERYLDPRSSGGYDQ